MINVLLKIIDVLLEMNFEGCSWQNANLVWISYLGNYGWFMLGVDFLQDIIVDFDGCMAQGEFVVDFEYMDDGQILGQLMMMD